VVAFDGSNENEALAQVNAITENKGVKYVFEAVSGKTFDFALKALAQHGHLLSFGALSGAFDVQVFIGLLLAKTPKIEGFVVTPWMNKKSPEEVRKITEELISLMVAKKLVPSIETVHPLEEFKEAIARAYTPGKLGRVFLSAHPEKVTK
jgi:NADPH:quinone reductase-like Zn-dependent oxidoreductase